MKKTYLLVLCTCLFYFARAQHTAYTEKDFARRPVWISMIKDTAVNYFEAEHAYKVYFQHHENPGGEDDEIGMHEAREKNPSKKEQRKMQADNHMRMAVKKYERWHDKMRPYVQADGSILSPSQRLQIWKANQSAK
jgi:hypothetical protein